MKKITIVAILMSIALLGCGEKKVEEMKEVTTEVVESTAEVKDKVMEAGAEVKDKVMETSSDVKDKVMETSSDVKDKVMEATANLSKEAKAMTADMKNMVADKMPETISFKDSEGKVFTLESSDEFETAILKTESGDAFSLKRDVSGSGTRLVDENGNEIHFDSKEGILKLNDKTINLNIEK